MKFQSQITVVGMKANKGTMENGQAYDSTKVYALTDLDNSKGMSVGQATSEFNIGTSDELAKYKHLPFPFVAMADCEIVTSGKATKTVIHAIKPLEPAKKS
ncbi:hypothetical protein [Roseateles microcysteis]|uniref:hypothetical protein n=1 Tax=Roseateles microcysteis TaxID=3119057 RepID=UPI002FE5E3BE